MSTQQPEALRLAELLTADEWPDHMTLVSYARECVAELRRLNALQIATYTQVICVEAELDTLRAQLSQEKEVVAAMLGEQDRLQCALNKSHEELERLQAGGGVVAGAFKAWVKRENANANDRLPGDDWIDDAEQQRDGFEAGWAAMVSLATTQPEPAPVAAAPGNWFCGNCRTPVPAPTAAPSLVPLTDEQIDKHLDRILKASGSALKHYTMQKPLDDMRAAFRSAIENKGELC